jgi:4-hydroxybenzoate polyprenyltransferase
MNTVWRLSSPLPSKLFSWWRRSLPWQRFIHFQAFGFTGMLLLLGAATAAPAVPLRTVAGLLLVGLAFHTFAFVLNDVVDLSLDRQRADRRLEPLITGAVHPRQALCCALVQIPIAFLGTVWLGAGAGAHMALALAFALMAIYDLWGKRNLFPPLTDLVQGGGWAALCVYGALVVSGGTTPLTWWLALTVTAMILLMNGVHASLRDAETDFGGGALTTALLLGVRPLGRGRLSMPLPFKIYAFLLQIGVMGLLAWPLLTGNLTVAGWLWWAVAGWLALLQGAVLACTYRLLQQPVLQQHCAYAAFHATMLCLLVPLAAADWPLALATLGVFVVPLLLFDSTYRAMHHASRQVARWRAAPR